MKLFVTGKVPVVPPATCQGVNPPRVRNLFLAETYQTTFINNILRLDKVFWLGGQDGRTDRQNADANNERMDNRDDWNVDVDNREIFKWKSILHTFNSLVWKKYINFNIITNAINALWRKFDFKWHAQKCVYFKTSDQKNSNFTKK